MWVRGRQFRALNYFPFQHSSHLHLPPLGKSVRSSQSKWSCENRRRKAFRVAVVCVILVGLFLAVCYKYGWHMAPLRFCIVYSKRITVSVAGQREVRATHKPRASTLMVPKFEGFNNTFVNPQCSFQNAVRRGKRVGGGGRLLWSR